MGQTLDEVLQGYIDAGYTKEQIHKLIYEDVEDILINNQIEEEWAQIQDSIITFLEKYGYMRAAKGIGSLSSFIDKLER